MRISVGYYLYVDVSGPVLIIWAFLGLYASSTVHGILLYMWALLGLYASHMEY